jgi:midasin (ATPase involved in ribosome maturation)
LSSPLITQIYKIIDFKPVYITRETIISQFFNSKNKMASTFINEFCPLPSSKPFISRLINATSNNDPILLCGPPACGKSILARYLFNNQFCKPTYQRFVRVQLSDHIDARQLIGQYCCSEIPGEFVWRPGPIAEALLFSEDVANKIWLLLEDVHNASPDSLSLIDSLLETRRLWLPHVQRTIEWSSSSGFQLILNCTSSVIPHE